MKLKQSTQCADWDSTDLQTHSKIHPAAKGSTDSTRVKPNIFKNLGEGLSQSNARPLLCHHYTCAYAGQIQSSCLKVKLNHRKKKSYKWSMRNIPVLMCIRTTGEVHSSEIYMNLAFVKGSMYRLNVPCRVCMYTHLKRVSERAEGLGTKLHDWVRTESVSHFKLADGEQPQGRGYL